MATQGTSRRHDLVPLSDLELQTLALYTDRYWNFLQNRANPPSSIIELRERFLALGGADKPPRHPPAVGAAAPEPSPSNDWHELLRLEVRWGVIVFALVASVVIATTSVVASIIVP